MDSNVLTTSRRVRRSRSLVLTFESAALLGYNFLAKQAATLDELATAILSVADRWTLPTDILLRLEGSYDPRRIDAEILRLLDRGVMVAEGSPLGDHDAEYESKWAWGVLAGLYHFGIRDPRYMSTEQMSYWLVDRVATTPPVPLCADNEAYEEVVQLPPPQLEHGTLSSTMRKRRSYRDFDSSKSLSLEDLRDCLFSGVGVVGFTDTPIEGEGRLPLTMTPSGGARNPYEAYVYVRRVTDIKPGIYHYSGLTNSLGFITDSALPEPGDILGEQSWFDDAAAVILLVANFERTWWKYPHPTGFRVVLIEAGHIAQNILLTATDKGLASAPTCAINDTVARQLLRLDSVTQATVYSVSIGVRSDSATEADPTEIIPNPGIEAEETPRRQRDAIQASG